MECPPNAIWPSQTSKDPNENTRDTDEFTEIREGLNKFYETYGSGSGAFDNTKSSAVKRNQTDDIIVVDTKSKKATVNKTDDDLDVVVFDGNLEDAQYFENGEAEQWLEEQVYSISHPTANGNDLSDFVSGFFWLGQGGGV